MSKGSSASASLLMKQFKDLTDPKKAIPSFHITVSPPHESSTVLY